MILGNIAEKEYTCETADRRGKTVPEALARLARLICADSEMLTKQEIIKMAKYVYDKQIQQICRGLIKVYSYTKILTSNEIPVVITGLGKDFLAKKAAEKIGVDNVIDLAKFIQNDAALATPAFGVALMVASELKGEIIQWMPK